ncbi:MAG: DNA-directed RNA polymerase subunit G [Desulfurococcales archaeon]|nr:DNA-directed RNA polymerase subunit G [Desulfurococcales archaeon]
MPVDLEIPCKVSKVEKSELPRTRIYKCKPGKGSGYIVFDLHEDLFFAGAGRSLSISLKDRKPSNLDDYQFCGKALKVQKTDDKAIYSIGGYILKIEDYKSIIGEEDLGDEIYFCIKT